MRSKGMRPIRSLPCKLFKRWKSAATLATAFVCTALLLVSDAGHAMQPPPPPLSVLQLERLVAAADVIALGEIVEVAEIDAPGAAGEIQATQAVMQVERLLKGKLRGNRLLIREPAYSAAPPVKTSKTAQGSKPRETIAHTGAGPSPYHGRYRKGNRVIMLLEPTTDGAAFKPLGAGTYDGYLCEFFIEEDHIATRYFELAEDAAVHAESEERFIRLIDSLLNRHSVEGTQ